MHFTFSKVPLSHSFSSLQDMSVMEGELEILLGELHIKMKGMHTDREQLTGYQ